MKDDTITFLAAGAHLGSTDLYFPMEQYIYRKKSGGVYTRNPKRTWENFCRQLLPSLPLKTQLLSLLRPPGTLASELSCSLLPPLLWSAALLLEPPLTRPRQLPGAKTPGGYEPRADRQPLPEACM